MYTVNGQKYYDYNMYEAQLQIHIECELLLS